MTWRILSGSLNQRRGRVAVSVCAIALGTSLIVSAVNLRQGIRARLGEELRNYGANLLVVPGAGTGPFLKQKDVAILEDERIRDRLIAYAPFLYGVAQVRGEDVVIGGTRFGAVRKVNPWWQIEGRWPEKKDEAIVGLNAASKLGFRLGDRSSLVYKNSRLDFSVAGTLHTGGAEEHQIFVNLEAFQQLTGFHGSLTSVLISSRAGAELEEAVEFLRRAWPQAEARTILQVARAEELLLSRLGFLLTMVSLFIMVGSAISVFSTTARAVLERRVEMALSEAR